MEAMKLAHMVLDAFEVVVAVGEGRNYMRSRRGLRMQ